MGPHDDLVAALDHAAGIFGHRKVVAWCLEWAIAHGEADPQVFACGIDESAGVVANCAECGEPVRWDEIASDYRHVSRESACLLALGAK